MRFVSLQNLGTHAGDAARRFPFALLSAVTAAGSALYLIDHNDDKGAIRLLLVALLGIPVFTAAVTSGERASWTARTRALVHGAFLLLLVGLWLAYAPWTETMRFTRFAHLAVLAHLAVAVLPFVGTRLDRAFWHFNRLLFVRYLTGGIFASVLFVGLAIALAAINKLFGVKIENEWYGRLWVVIALVFHPWFFLAGVPRDLPALETRDDYPAGLKVFAQFILIPVVTVYMGILTAYLAKVVVTRTWPSGWIGILVSSVSVAGTLALLLVHPARERADSKWVDVYGRWFYVALLPSIGMLLMAVWLRIQQYGLTERRYFLAILALWLAGIAIYYGVTGSRNIRVIPTTLGAVALVTFLGPWSAYSVSRDSQLRRFRDMLATNEVPVGSRLGSTLHAIPFEQRRDMSDVVRYLLDMHGPGSLAPISDTLRRVAEHPPSGLSSVTGLDVPAARAVMDRLGVTYVSRSESRQNERTTNFHAVSPDAVALDGFEWMMHANLTAPFTIALGTDTLTFATDSQPVRMIVSRHGERLLEIPVWRLVEQARAIQSPDRLQPGDRLQAAPPRASGGGVPPPPPTQTPLMLDVEGTGLRARLIVNNLNATGDSTHARLTADATILLHFTKR